MLNAFDQLKHKYRNREDIKLWCMVNGVSGTAWISFVPHTKYDAYYVEVTSEEGYQGRAAVLTQLAHRAERILKMKAPEEEKWPVNVYRVEILVIDTDRLGEQGVIDMIEHTRYPNHALAPSVKSIEGRTVQWHDGHPLNMRDTHEEAYRELFK